MAETGVHSFTSRNGRGTISYTIGDDDVFDVHFPPTEKQTMESELKNYGYTDAEVLEIQKRLNDANSINSTVSGTSSSPNGSLVSNSAQSLSNTALYQQASLQIERNKVDAMNASNEIQRQKLDVMDANLIVQSQILEALKSLTTATKEQKLTTGDIKVNPSIHIDTTNLSEANAKIAEGVENQIQTNAKLVENLTKKNEHLDYLKNGSDSLKDTNGDVIKPREVEAKLNAEKHIEQSDINRTTIDEFLEFVPDLLDGATESAGELLGTTDGFDINFNPMAYIDEILLDDFMQHKDHYNKDEKV